jgi:hypothetical protein
MPSGDPPSFGGTAIAFRLTSYVWGMMNKPRLRLFINGAGAVLRVFSMRDSAEGEYGAI